MTSIVGIMPAAFMKRDRRCHEISVRPSTARSCTASACMRFLRGGHSANVLQRVFESAAATAISYSAFPQLREEWVVVMLSTFQELLSSSGAPEIEGVLQSVYGFVTGLESAYGTVSGAACKLMPVFEQLSVRSGFFGKMFLLAMRRTLAWDIEFLEKQNAAEPRIRKRIEVCTKVREAMHTVDGYVAFDGSLRAAFLFAIVTCPIAVPCKRKKLKP